MQAKEPRSSKTFYFVDKCLPFGASISHSHFQHFSNALKHIFEYLWREEEGISKLDPELRKDLIKFITNYLDDFLFIALTVGKCNKMVNVSWTCAKHWEF